MGALGRIKWNLALNQSRLNERYIAINVLKAMNSIVLYGFCNLLIAVNTFKAAFQPALILNVLCNIGFLIEVHCLLKLCPQFHKRSITLPLVLNPSGDKSINHNEIGLFLECFREQLYIPDFNRPHG